MRSDTVAAKRVRVLIALAVAGALAVMAGLVLAGVGLAMRLGHRSRSPNLTTAGLLLAAAGTVFGIVVLTILAVSKASAARARRRGRPQPARPGHPARPCQAGRPGGGAAGAAVAGAAAAAAAARPGPRYRDGARRGGAYGDGMRGRGVRRGEGPSYQEPPAGREPQLTQEAQHHQETQRHQKPRAAQQPPDLQDGMFIYRDTGGPEEPDEPEEIPGYGPPGPEWYANGEESPDPVPDELGYSRGPFEPYTPSGGSGPQPAAGFGVPAYWEPGIADGDPAADAGPEALEQIKDLYRTAEAIGEDNVDKHFDELLERQRELITAYFRSARPGGARGAVDDAAEGSGEASLTGDKGVPRRR